HPRSATGTSGNLWAFRAGGDFIFPTENGVERKRAHLVAPRLATDEEDEIIDTTVRSEGDDVVDDATTETRQQGGELELSRHTLLLDDATVDEEASNVAAEGVKDVTSLHKTKKRKSIKGVVAKKRARGASDKKGKGAAYVMAVIPMAEEGRSRKLRERERWETRNREKMYRSHPFFLPSPSSPD
ncbi:hypothetical protein Dimus_037061, partial [Dionaea muscipula]